MTKDDLTRLDNYGHKALDSLSLDHLRQYMLLLIMRRQEVLERIRELRKVATGRTK